jgi:phosphoadenosine phosphosulfate reductase
MSATGPQPGASDGAQSALSAPSAPGDARLIRAQDATLDYARVNAELERLSPEERLRAAVERFGDGLLFTSSFGSGSAVLLHMWSRVARHLPVVCIDTGFLFAETIAYRDAIVEKLGLTLEIARPKVPRGQFLEEHGSDIYYRNSDFCCAQNKVAPLEPHLARARAWVSGLRRDQSSTRKDTPILLPTEDGPVKVHPLATMTAGDVAAYMAEHALPEHPLKAKRYLSIGCEPCTRPVEDGEDERAGRWAGSGKTECGIHTRLKPKG